MTTNNTTDGNKQALEPCPFCGRESKIEAFQIHDDPQWWYVATCVICPVKTYDQTTPQDASRIWNTRFRAGAVPANEWLNEIEAACNAALLDVYELSIANAPVDVPYARGTADCIGHRVGQIREAVAAIRAAATSGFISPAAASEGEQE